MKTNFASLIFLSLILVSTSCHHSADPISVKEVNARLIASQVWAMKQVTIDGTDQSDSFKGLTLGFNAEAYTTTNGHVVWPASGTWKFIDDEALSIVRDDQVTIIIQEIDSDKLVLALDWASTTIGGKANSVKGHHVFTFAH